MIELGVWWRGRRVGTVTNQAGDRMAFRYADEWTRSEDAFPISLSLPLGREEFGEAAHCFFANLLPEADVRVRLCQQLKVSPGNDFELLGRIGGECAGALNVGPEPGEPDRGEPRYIAVDPEELRRWSLAKLPDVFSTVVGRDGVRLSLAGAQDKLPVRIEGEEVRLPVGGAASTHVLKFASARFKHLPENECLMAIAARRLGLVVSESRLWRLPRGGRILVVERYDRRIEEGEVVRLHQEDFCQALGRSPLRKYEKEGGPSAGELAEVVRRYGSIPAMDLRTLIRWQLFNWLFGNADGHAKNLSLLIEQVSGVRLAPIYDLVCTQIYKTLDRSMAMSIGGSFDPGQIAVRSLERHATDMQLGAASVVGMAREMVADGRRHLTEAIVEFRDRYGDSAVLDMVQLQVNRNLRRAATTLG